MHKRAFIIRSVLQNVNAITLSLLPQSTECNAMINILHIIAYVKHECTNAFILTSIFRNVNASILPKNAECNATIRLTLCTTLLMKSNNRQMHEIGIAQW